MAVAELEILCMAATPMHDDFTIDEQALRTDLRRLVAARNGIYLGSGGAGEGHSLSPKELRRVYAIGVEEAKGKVPLYANPRESRTAEAMYEVAREAVAAGVDMVQLYQVDAGHGMTPTLREQEAYFSWLLDRIDHPVALSMHVFSGFLAPPALLATLCSRYPQIKAINVMGPPDRYFMQVRDALPASVRLYTGTSGLPTLTALGAVGALGAENNCIPNVCKRIGDAIVAGDLAALSENMITLKRFGDALAQFIPSGGSARGVKMGMKALGLGNGVIRPPYLQVPDEDVQKLAARFAELHIAEIEGIRQPAAA